ncbi:MAG: DUF4351 domain-containing protein [Planctomycetaceae bacterium]|jgi:predicted transposase YdaD|nr:DUF4351 domain-containing protein [Planctomycetaceae bacterium]
MVTSTLEKMYIEGKLEGKLEGKIEGKIEGVLRLLNNRFHKIPESVSHTVNSYTDLTVLDSLFDRAYECETLAEFEEYLVSH